MTFIGLIIVLDYFIEIIKGHQCCKRWIQLTSYNYWLARNICLHLYLKLCNDKFRSPSLILLHKIASLFERMLFPTLSLLDLITFKTDYLEIRLSLDIYDIFFKALAKVIWNSNILVVPVWNYPLPQKGLDAVSVLWLQF